MGIRGWLHAYSLLFRLSEQGKANTYRLVCESFLLRYKQKFKLYNSKPNGWSFEVNYDVNFTKWKQLFCYAFLFQKLLVPLFILKESIEIVSKAFQSRNAYKTWLIGKREKADWKLSRWSMRIGLLRVDKLVQMVFVWWLIRGSKNWAQLTPMMVKVFIT